MAERNIVMQRKKTDGTYDIYYPKTRASNGTTFDEHLNKKATENQLGHVKVDGTTIVSDANGAISAKVGISQILPFRGGIKAPLPSAQRDYFAAEEVDGILYVFTCHRYSQVTHGYNPLTGTWTAKADSPDWFQRGVVSGVINKIIHLVDGSSSAHYPHYAYNPATNTWDSKTPLKSPVVQHACGGVIDGLLYVYGGRTPTAVYEDSLRAYNPATDTWTSKKASGVRRSRMDSGVIDGILYVTGGWDGSTISIFSTQAYNPKTNTWESKAGLPESRYYFGADVLDGLLYCFGGWDSDGVFANDVFVYDPETDEWSTIESMPVAGIYTRVCNVDNVLYVITKTDEDDLQPTVQAYGGAKAEFDRKSIAILEREMFYVEEGEALYTKRKSWSSNDNEELITIPLS